MTLGTDEPASVCEVVQGTFDSGVPEDPPLGVFHMMIPTAELPIPVQLILLPTPWPAVLFESTTAVSVLGCTVPVVSWQALLLFKLYAGGPSDLLDALEIWKVRQPVPRDIQQLRETAQRVNLLDEFDAFVQRVKAAG